MLLIKESVFIIVVNNHFQRVYVCVDSHYPSIGFLFDIWIDSKTKLNSTELVKLPKTLLCPIRKTQTNDEPKAFEYINQHIGTIDPILSFCSFPKGHQDPVS